MGARLPTLDPAQAPEGWVVYMLHCGDQTLYTGIARDFAKRLAAHRAGKGARYTRTRGPLVCVYLEAAPSRGAALRREHEIKRMSRAEKLDLVLR